MKLFQIWRDDFTPSTSTMNRYFYPNKNTITEVGYILVYSNFSVSRTMNVHYIVDTKLYLFYRNTIGAYGYCVLPNMVSSVTNPQGIFPLILSDDMGLRFQFLSADGTAGPSYIVMFIREFDEEKYFGGGF